MVMPSSFLGPFANRIIATRCIPPREPTYAALPKGLHASLKAALEEDGVAQLYSHQAEAFAAACTGENVVITTGTASGKSLAYLLPVIQRVLDEPSARAVLVFPTKALSNDQLRSVLRLIQRLSGRRIEAGVYDGDTTPAERVRIRDRANIVITNPDMLNAALLPSHGRQGFSHIFRNVRFVVIDELHSYRGAFGSHLANLLRRLHRVLDHYGSRPQFLCSSATIANAKEHAETICSRPFRLIDRDGSPAAGKTIHFWQPPLTKNDVRRAVTGEMGQLLPYLIENRRRTIAFCRSRKETEIVLKESRDHLSHVAGVNEAAHDEGYLLAGYRAGYKPEERKAVELALQEGRLLGVVSTNALELGIDIGQLEVVVQGGFPGTRASFWQQMGRAGRRNKESHAVVILAQSPIDQYIAEDPDWLVAQPAEHAVVDRDNLAIQLAHVRAAAAELPLTLNDVALFPDLGEILPVLQKAGDVRETLGSYHWHGAAHPAGEFSLRNIDKDRFKLVNRDTGVTLTEMDRPQVYREAHPRAVYLHDGTQYLVESLDLVGHVATVTEVEQNFYTQPDVRTAISVIIAQEHRTVDAATAHFGDVRVDDTVVGYKMLEFHNHQNLGYEALHEPLRLTLETEGVWIAVPEHVLASLGHERKDALAGMVHAVVSAARMRTMAEAGDLRGTSFHFVDDTTGHTKTALICHDTYPGGLGYAVKAYDYLPEIVAQAVTLVTRCRCARGCPACVGDYVRDKQLIGWALQQLTEASPMNTARGDERIPWDQLGAQWSDITARIQQRGLYGGEWLSGIRRLEKDAIASPNEDSAAIYADRLVFTLRSPGLCRWLEEEATIRRLLASLAAVVVVPSEARIEARLDADAGEQAMRRSIKIQRRFDDLHAGRATDGEEATTKLQSGFEPNGPELPN